DSQAGERWRCKWAVWDRRQAAAARRRQLDTPSLAIPARRARHISADRRYLRPRWRARLSAPAGEPRGLPVGRFHRCGIARTKNDQRTNGRCELLADVAIPSMPPHEYTKEARVQTAQNRLFRTIQNFSGGCRSNSSIAISRTSIRFVIYADSPRIAVSRN